MTTFYQLSNPAPIFKLPHIKQINLYFEISLKARIVAICFSTSTHHHLYLQHLSIMDAFKGKFERTSADNYEEFLKVTFK